MQLFTAFERPADELRRVNPHRLKVQRARGEKQHLAALCNRSVDAGDGEKAAVSKVTEEKQLRKRLVVFCVAGEKLPAAVKVQQAACTGDRFAVANKDAEHGIRQNAKRFCGVMARAVFCRRNGKKCAAFS